LSHELPFLGAQAGELALLHCHAADYRNAHHDQENAE
jgi:hypothetical protein